VNLLAYENGLYLRARARNREEHRRGARGSSWFIGGQDINSNDVAL